MVNGRSGQWQNWLMDAAKTKKYPWQPMVNGRSGQWQNWLMDAVKN